MPWVHLKTRSLWVPDVAFEKARVALGGVDHFGAYFESREELLVIGEILTPTPTFHKHLAIDRSDGKVFIVDSFQSSIMVPARIAKINSSYEQLIGSIGLYTVWLDLILALGESRDHEIVKALHEATLQIRTMDDFEDAVWPESLNDIPRLL